MAMKRDVQNAVLAETQKAARHAAYRYAPKDKDAWRESWGFVFEVVAMRIQRMSELPVHFEFWLRRTANGEALKYYRIERSSGLV